MKEFFDAVESSREEYEKCVSFPFFHCRLLIYLCRVYLPELARIRATKDSKLAAAKTDGMRRMMADLSVDRARNPGAFANDRWDPDAEGGDDDEDVDADDPDLIDRSA